jgi:mono/diheme cytochrome c family protein
MAKRIFGVITAMIVGVVLLASQVVYAGEYDKGKTLFEEKCMICHGADGKGDGPAAMALSPAPRDFSRAEFWNRKQVDQIITNQIKNGKGAMPAFKLNDDEIKEIIAYMRHTFKKSP